MKVVLDSSGWIEFFTGGPLADRYATYLAPRYRCRKNGLRDAQTAEPARS